MSEMRPCYGPLHKGALVENEFFFDEERRCCEFCLVRNREWKARNKHKVKTWKNSPDVRLSYNLRQIGIGPYKKEELTPLLLPGMGWSNYYIKGKRSWRFTELTAVGFPLLEASWWSPKRISSGIALAER